MGIEVMKTMKTQLMSCIQGQMGDLKHADAKELGEAVDMVKDLSEAIYYCTITEAMEKGSEQ
jgi:ribosome-binding factor A